MAHEIAKLMLEHAESFLERSEAIKTALYLGMPLNEIEGYLDWLDSVKQPAGDTATQHGTTPERSGKTGLPGSARPRGQFGPSSLGPFGCSRPFTGPAGS